MKKALTLVLCMLLIVTGCTLPALAQEAPTKLSILKQNDNEVWDPVGNPALAKLLKDANVEIDLQLADDINQAINLSMASGDLCDIIVAPRFAYQEYVDSGYLLELSALLENYGQNLLGTISQQAWDYVKVNGGIYCVPQENLNSKYITAIREDWLVNLGFEVKEYYTTSELKEILIAFANNDPDGNGEKDTYGMNAHGDVWKNTPAAIYGAFGGQPDQYYLNDNNEFYAYNTSDSFRAALTYLNELWNAGAIDPEFFVASGDQAQLKATNGKIGYFSGWWNKVRVLTDNGFLDINPGASFKRIFITGDDGVTQGMVDNGLITKTTFITTKCENPEAAMAFLNYLSSDEGYVLANTGLEGYHFEVAADGSRHNLYSDKNDWCPLSEITRRLDVVVFYDTLKLKPAQDADAKIKMLNPFQLIQYETGLKLYTNVFYGLAITDSDVEYGTELANYVTSKVVEFVTGETALDDANWANYQADWAAKGGMKIMESYAKLYNEIHGTNLTVAK